MSSRKIPIRYTGLENVKERSQSEYAFKILQQGNEAQKNNADSMQSSVEFENVMLENIRPRSINKYSQTRIRRLAKSIRDTNNRLINPITLVDIRNLPINGDVIKKFIAEGEAKVNEVDNASGETVREIKLSELDDAVERRNRQIADNMAKGEKSRFATRLVLDTGLKYIIVAGERRYRAFLLLRDEENEKPHEAGWINPFLTITANILTPQEAKNEAVFYEESNTQSRQLTPEEAMRHFETAVKQVDSDDSKYAMLLEMERAGVSFRAPIPDDLKSAVKMFRMPAYCVYYLETELGIQGWTESSVKGYLTVLNNSCDEVKDAVFATQYSLREAKSITKFDYEVQRSLLALWLSGDIMAYRKQIDKLNSAAAKPVKRTTNNSAGRNIDKIVKSIKDDIDLVKQDEKSLKGEPRQMLIDAIDKCERLAAELAEISAKIKKM